MAVHIGDKLKNRYRVEESLGRGGMADVYKVWDEERSTYLALKLLRDDLAQDPVFMRRFRREAHNLAQLQHPNIVRFYGLEEDDLKAFILMEYIEGPTLREEILRSGSGGLSLERIQSVMKDVCSALHYAHAKGLVHCDIKSGNILIDASGKAYLTDFGIARGMDMATSTMVGIGTPAYMAPELIKGQEPTPQTDIYALGIVLYEMLTGGERPFTGEQASITGTTAEKVRWEHLEIEPPPIKNWNKEISEEINSVVMQCLDKKANQRINSAGDLYKQLFPIDDNARNSTIKQEKSIAPKNQGEEIIKEEDKQDSLPKKSVGKEEQSVKTSQRNVWRLLVPILVVIALTVSGFIEYTLRRNDFKNDVIEVLSPWNQRQECMLLFSSSMAGDNEIYSIGIESGRITPLTNNHFDDYRPSWSPDGTRIAFSSDILRYHDDVFLFDSSMDIPKALTSDYVHDSRPVWSPDGKRIAYESDGDIWIMNFDGRNKIQVTDTDYIEQFPAWSPDGKKLVFTSDQDGDDELFIIDLETKNLQQITFNLVSDWTPDWSPNGKRIVFASGEEETKSIYSIDLNGNSLRRWTIDFGNCESPVWSPDGRYVAFTSDESGAREVYMISVDLQNVERITYIFGEATRPSWSPLCAFD